MKPVRKVSRRSFLATVTGAAVAGGTLLGRRSEAGMLQVTDRDPGDPVGRGRGGPGSGVTDRDPSDPIGRGRGAAGGTRSGITDGDPSDPVGNGRGGRRTGVTDGDPTDPVGSGRGGSAARSGCSDSDPTDPGGDGRHCGTRGGTSDVHPTGRRERRYEVCWVDHPSRSNEDCNVQIYSEWMVTYSDGHVEFDTTESMRRRAEMEASGYTARWHRMIVNDWPESPAR